MLDKLVDLLDKIMNIDNPYAHYDPNFDYDEADGEIMTDTPMNRFLNSRAGMYLDRKIQNYKRRKLEKEAEKSGGNSQDFLTDELYQNNYGQIGENAEWAGENFGASGYFNNLYSDMAKIADIPSPSILNLAPIKDLNSEEKGFLSDEMNKFGDNSDFEQFERSLANENFLPNDFLVDNQSAGDNGDKEPSVVNNYYSSNNNLNFENVNINSDTDFEDFGQRLSAILKDSIKNRKTA